MFFYVVPRILSNYTKQIIIVNKNKPNNLSNLSINSSSNDLELQGLRQSKTSNDSMGDVSHPFFFNSVSDPVID